MAEQTLSVAVIGAGMAGRSHAYGYRQAGSVFDSEFPSVRLAAVADMNQELGRDTARRYGFEKVYGDWTEVAEDPEIDAVSIVVGNALHLPIARGLLEAGKHVLCEKPLAGTLEDAQAMAEIEASHPDQVFATGFTFRRNAGVAMLAKIAAEGSLGTIGHIDAHYWCDYGADPQVPMAWRYRGPMGSGALGDVGSHLVDSAELIGGPIVEVSGAQLATIIQERPVLEGAVAGGRGVSAAADAPREAVENDDVATFTARFASGALGTFSCSRVAYGMPNDKALSVMGSEGTAMWSLARTGEIRIADSSSPTGLGGLRQVYLGLCVELLELLVRDVERLRAAVLIISTNPLGAVLICLKPQRGSLHAHRKVLGHHAHIVTFLCQVLGHRQNARVVVLEPETLRQNGVRHMVEFHDQATTAGAQRNGVVQSPVLHAQIVQQPQGLAGEEPQFRIVPLGFELRNHHHG